MPYVDTSFIIKLYMFEPESHLAKSVAERFSEAIQISSLTDVEMVSALTRRLKPRQSARAIAHYRADRDSDLYDLVPWRDAVFLRAVTIGERYAKAYSLRSLDILHLAVALENGITSFATFDGDLARAAGHMGFAVLPSVS